VNEGERPKGHRDRGHDLSGEHFEPAV